jgi:antitoxin component YwqK of YwqJK toxin-antitoxin module
MKNLLMFVLFLVGAHWSVLGQNKTDAAGRKQGPWIKYQGDGTTPLYTGTFKDNIPVGEFRYFYPSGKVKMIVKHETKDRSYAWFYSEKEDLMSEGQYLKMKKDSVWKNYAYDGALLSTETYRSDQLHGERKVFYTQGQMETGEIKIYTVERYLNNQLDGSFEAYKMSGSLEETGLYVKNLKEGYWYRYYPNGQLLSKIRYKGGKAVGYSYSFDEKGNEVYKGYWLDGERLNKDELKKYLEKCKKNGTIPEE